MEEELELALQKIAELEKKLEKYYDLLFVENELDFILRGSYMFDDDLDKILAGNYTI